MDYGTLKITSDGRVSIDEAEIKGCTFLSVKIDPGTQLEVELRAVVDGIDIEYGGIKRTVSQT